MYAHINVLYSNSYILHASLNGHTNLLGWKQLFISGRCKTDGVVVITTDKYCKPHLLRLDETLIIRLYDLPYSRFIIRPTPQILKRWLTTLATLPNNHKTSGMQVNTWKRYLFTKRKGKNTIASISPLLFGICPSRVSAAFTVEQQRFEATYHFWPWYTNTEFLAKWNKQEPNGEYWGESDRFYCHFLLQATSAIFFVGSYRLGWKVAIFIDQLPGISTETCFCSLLHLILHISVLFLYESSIES